MKLLVSILLLISAAAFANEDKIYSPNYCEFSVEFPNSYRKSTSISALGTSINAAKLSPTRTTSIAAECWRYNHELTIDEFAQTVREGYLKKGVNVTSVQIEHLDDYSRIIISGTVGNTKIAHMKNILNFGETSRMDLFIIEEQMASMLGLNFRNSLQKVK